MRERKELIWALRDYAKWTLEAQDENNVNDNNKISIDDMDAELLSEAADELERIGLELGRAYGEIRKINESG